MEFWLYADSERGYTRSNNEDSYRCVYLSERKQWLLCLADGMGGAKGGEVAGYLAIETAINYLSLNLDNEISSRKDRACLLEAFNQANIAVYLRSLQYPELSGMGSTLLIALIDHNGNALVANIGDSRAYIWHKQKLTQVTTDHNLAQELLDKGEIDAETFKSHKGRHMLTQAIGALQFVEPDVFPLTLTSDQRLILCSDGIHGYVDEATMATALARSHTAEASTRNLIQAALSVGGHDNSTVICLCCG